MFCYENDNELIDNFIESIEPDYRYANSDDLTTAMVESVENLASVNDYVTECTYEAYAISESVSDFAKKVGAKISAYFQLFLEIIKKFIAKVKSFFMNFKRQFSMALLKLEKHFLDSDVKSIEKNKDKYKKPVTVTGISTSKIFNTKFNDLIKLLGEGVGYGPNGDSWSKALNANSYDDSFSNNKIKTNDEGLMDDLKSFTADNKALVVKILDIDTIPESKQTFKSVSDLSGAIKSVGSMVMNAVDKFYRAIMKSSAADIAKLKENRKKYEKAVKDAETPEDVKAPMKMVKYINACISTRNSFTFFSMNLFIKYNKAVLAKLRRLIADYKKEASKAANGAEETDKTEETKQPTIG